MSFINEALPVMNIQIIYRFLEEFAFEVITIFKVLQSCTVNGVSWLVIPPRKNKTNPKDKKSHK